MSSLVRHEKLVYVPVWQRTPEIEDAFAAAKVGDQLLSEMVNEYRYHASVNGPLTPTEVMQLANDLAKAEVATWRYVYAIPLIDMTSTISLEPIDLTLENLEISETDTKVIGNSVRLLESAFTLTEAKSAALVPEGYRSVFPPLVNLNQRNAINVDNSLGRASMTVKSTIRVVPLDAQIKGWAFIGFNVEEYPYAD